MTPIALSVNGRKVQAMIEPRTHLADFLREHCRLTGTHLGCEHGVCGACTVLVDGKPARSCITYAVQYDGVAVQTIKAVARRRWQEGDTQRRFSWYEPLKEPDAIRRAVHFVLSRPGLFLNSSSDATVLRQILDAALEAAEEPSAVELDADVARFSMQPLFVRGISDSI